MEDVLEEGVEENFSPVASYDYYEVVKGINETNTILKDLSFKFDVISIIIVILFLYIFFRDFVRSW